MCHGERRIFDAPVEPLLSEVEGRSEVEARAPLPKRVDPNTGDVARAVTDKGVAAGLLESFFLL